MKITLKPVLLGLGLLSLAVAFSGCIVSIGGSLHGSDHDAPGTVAVTDSADAATVAEIDAVAKLKVDDDRTHALAQIAERGPLAAPVQVHLVNVTYRSLGIDNNKTHVLTKVIARADFSDAARHAIVSQLSKLSSDTNRQFVLQQINERLKATPAH